jgi:hypothetical protein
LPVSLSAAQSPYSASNPFSLSWLRTPACCERIVGSEAGQGEVLVRNPSKHRLLGIECARRSRFFHQIQDRTDWLCRGDCPLIRNVSRPETFRVLAARTRAVPSGRSSLKRIARVCLIKYRQTITCARDAAGARIRLPVGSPHTYVLELAMMLFLSWPDPARSRWYPLLSEGEKCSV